MSSSKVKQRFSSCSVCKRDITHLHIRCAVCTTPTVDLCGECFARGSTSPEVPLHQASHAYQVVDNLSAIVLFDKEWSAREELLLLDAIEMYGLGNWKQIAVFIGSKSEQQCQKHYMAVYLESPTAPLPSGDPTVNYSGTKDTPTHATSETGVPPPSQAGPRTGGPTSLGTPGYSHAHVPKTDVAGYMPLRGDFDIEHDNEAEAILADMDFVEGEHATETELKLKILEIYNAKLDERERRKQFVIERGLLEYKRMLAVERRRPKEEREVYDALRPFARFLSSQEFEDLVRGIVLEHRLRKRIAQLQEYRRAGIRNLAEAQEYETAKKKREHAASLKRNTALVEAVAAETEMMTRGGKVIQRKGALDTPLAALNSTATTGVEVGKKRKREEMSAELPKPLLAEGELPFTLEGIPGVDRLTQEERKLCEYLRLLPNQYQQIKTTIVNISLSRGHVQKSEAAGRLVHVDVAKVNGVFDFCVSSGWAVPGAVET